MTFGKKGRPQEDRLARQREIFIAVSPLILHVGARQLSMQQAARAACLSIGGLYHYFPTKRDLVLHGLCPEAIFRFCQDFHARLGHLAYIDPERYLEEGIEVIVEQIGFCRPAIHAALELGTDSFWDVIEPLLAGTTQEFEVNLRRVAPEMNDEELHRWGRAIRRTMCAALFDKNITPDELRDDLHMLAFGHLKRVRRDGRTLAAPPTVGVSLATFTHAPANQTP